MTEKPTPKYINPMVDFGFKKIFKESGKKQAHLQSSMGQTPKTKISLYVKFPFYIFAVGP